MFPEPKNPKKKVPFQHFYAVSGGEKGILVQCAESHINLLVSLLCCIYPLVATVQLFLGL